ncbi:MAG: hypothetical protein CMJ39_11920 [Phycisphaerae bacterium]|nr:hypothetical protein [Phycisphaerae bacterium]
MEEGRPAASKASWMSSLLDEPATGGLAMLILVVLHPSRRVSWQSNSALKSGVWYATSVGDVLRPACPHRVHPRNMAC